MELSEVLNDKEPEVVTPETPETTEVSKPDLGARKAFQEKERVAQDEGRQRAPDGKFVAKEPEKEPEKPETKPEPTKPVAQDLTEKERAFLARANDETRKRQALEQELAQLKAKPAEPPKPFYEDPEGALKQFEDRILQQNQQTQQAMLQQRIATAEIIARKQYPDFDEMVPIFAQLLQATPGLHQQWVQAMDPAEFAYRTAKNIKQIREAGSLEVIRAEAEKAARIKLEAEFRQKEQDLLKQREALPDSLSNARGTSQPRVVWNGPPSLEDILK